MEFIAGKPLSDAWKELSEDQKEALAKEVAKLVVNLSETRFDKIGGMSPALESAPTVEGSKLFKGRVFHTWLSKHMTSLTMKL